MNKDLDERLIPDGEYRDASNIQISSTESDDSGSIQDLSGTLTIPKGMTIYGNFAVVELDSGKMIGYAAAGVTVSVAGS